MIGLGAAETEVGVLSTEGDAVFLGIAAETFHLGSCQVILAAEYDLETGLGHHQFLVIFLCFVQSVRCFPELVDVVPARFAGIDRQRDKVSLHAGQQAAGRRAVGQTDSERLVFVDGFPRLVLLEGKGEGIELFHIGEQCGIRLGEHGLFGIYHILLLIHDGHYLFSLGV